MCNEHLSHLCNVHVHLAGPVQLLLQSGTWIPWLLWPLCKLNQLPYWDSHRQCIQCQAAAGPWWNIYNAGTVMFCWPKRRTWTHSSRRIVWNMQKVPVCSNIGSRVICFCEVRHLSKGQLVGFKTLHFGIWSAEVFCAVQCDEHATYQKVCLSTGCIKPGRKVHCDY